MRIHLTLAIFISILLVGWASWSRISSSSASEAGLIAVEKKETDDKEYYDNVILPVLENSATSTLPSESPRERIDLVGRQLILDYVEMASKGDVSEKDITSLATRYVESIPTLAAVQTLSYTELTLSSSDKASLKRYANEMEPIYQTYVKGLSKAETYLEGATPDYYAFAAEAGEVYARTVERLKAVEVPAVLAQAHLGLTNAYLANSSNLKAVSRAEEDSASAFAALLTVNENVENEKRWAIQIAGILKSNGI